MSNKKENQKHELESWEIEVPEFIPTRHELLQIVKEYHLEDLEIQWSWFRNQVSGLCDDRYLFGLRRIGQIEKLLGEEEVEKAIAEAREDYGKYLEHEYWQIFLHGDEEQWVAAQNEIREETRELRESLQEVRNAW